MGELGGIFGQQNGAGNSSSPVSSSATSGNYFAPMTAEGAGPGQLPLALIGAAALVLLLAVLVITRR